ncbi:MAG TPA: c-type cytochrome domain-containing protein [Kofleriaceae bacterium]|nr:c-type cytochrome domain-containing protein [Kofleriaceae bacterium]
MKSSLLLVAVAACDITYVPDVGPLQNEPAADVDGGTAGMNQPLARCIDSDPSTDVSFSLQIRPLTTRSPGGCLSCHGTNTTSGFNLGSYESLRRGGLNSGTRIIVAGDPCASILPQKLGVAPPYGARMPYNGPPYFTPAELTLVRDWIAEGAVDN